MLESLLTELASRISKQRGFKTPYNIVIKPELPKDSKERDRIILIKAGTPPTICISKLYIEYCVALKEARKSGVLPELRDTMERALEFLPKMYHTLSLIPIAEAVSLRRDSKKWARANVPGLKVEIPDRYFTISYAITIKDTITNTEITVSANDKNKEEVIKTAKFRLSRMIIEEEENEERIEKLLGIEASKHAEAKPNEVSIIVGEDTRTEIKLEY